MVEIIVLRVVHLVGGMFWVGSAVFGAIYLAPAMREAGPAAGAMVGVMQRRHLFTVMPMVALLTILSGVRLMWITSAGFSAAYFATGRGATFAVGGAAAIIAFCMGVFINRPMGIRIGEIQQAIAKATDDGARSELSAQLDRLQRQSATVGWLFLVLLMVAAVGMAVGRYVM
jgi:uncharacterized membrane protein